MKSLYLVWKLNGVIIKVSGKFDKMYSIPLPALLLPAVCSQRGLWALKSPKIKVLLPDSLDEDTLDVLAPTWAIQ